MRHQLSVLLTFTLFVFLFGGLSVDIWAQQTNLPAQQSLPAMQDTLPTTTQLQIREVRFSGNEFVSDEVLTSITRTRSNREFLGIPGFTPWYWFWLLNEDLGEPPYYLDRTVLSRDMERIQTYYESQGYFDTEVDTSVIEYTKGNVEVSFIVSEGPSSTLRNIIYSGFPEELGRQRRMQFFEETLLSLESISSNDTTFSVDTRFTFAKISTERDRIVSFLKNNGYASTQKDSIKFYLKRDSLDQELIDVLININHGKVYRFGNTQISLSGPTTYGNYNLFDTLRTESSRGTQSLIFIEKASSAQTNDGLLFSQLSYKGGDIFDNSQYMNTIRNFQNVGIFNIRRYALSQDGGLPNYSSETLPVFFDLQTVPKHNIKLNIFGFQRYGYGTGLGLTYQNRNLFRDAERLEVGLKGSFELADLSKDNQILSSREATIQYSEPRLNFPLSFLNENDLFENSRTTYQLRYSQVNQINFNINANVGFNTSYEVNHSPTTSSTFDIIDLEWLDVSANQRFVNDINSNPSLSPLQRAFILNDFTPQINSVLSYTFRNINTDVIQHDDGFYFETGFEVGGNIPFLVDRYINESDRVTGSISFYDGANLSYSQYFKLTVDYRRYIPLEDNLVFAYRGFAGWAIPYGNNRSIPLTRRFFAGGSNDIRGWAPGILGPGPSQSLETSVTNGGEIKLGAFTEIRQELSKNFLSTRWLMGYFIDAGNIWNGSQSPIEQGTFRADQFYNEIAVSSGAGIRLDWQYLILRIDAAFRLHEPTSDGWFENGELYWSFGIGHSF